jgi:hypothetical protein
MNVERVIDRRERGFVDDRPFLDRVQPIDLHPSFLVGLVELMLIYRMLVGREGGFAGKPDFPRTPGDLLIGNVGEIGRKRRKFVLRDQLHFRPLA